VLRFTNQNVLEDIAGALEQIRAELTSAPATATPSPPAERRIKGMRSARHSRQDVSSTPNRASTEAKL
jgi:hypothetical protein